MCPVRKEISNCALGRHLSWAGRVDFFMQLLGDIIQEEVWNVCKVYFVGRLCRSVSSVKVSQSVYRYIYRL